MLAASTTTLLRVLVGLALVLSPAWLPMASARADDLTETEVLEQLKIDGQVGEYIFVIDISGSMKEDGVYAGVRDALARFLANLSPQDHVALITFAEKPTVRQGLAGRQPDELLEKIPRQATGSFTDIGSALEAAVGVLKQEGSLPLATVVLLTDGEHNRVDDSAYPFRAGASWDKLRDAATAATKKKESFSAFSVPLRENTDADLLRSVFTGGELMPESSVEELGQRLDKPREQMLSAKIKKAVTGDDTATVFVIWPELSLSPGSNKVTVGLRSNAKLLSLSVNAIAFESADPALTIATTATEITIPATETRSLELTVTWAPGRRSNAPWKSATPGVFELKGTSVRRRQTCWKRTSASVVPGASTTVWLSPLAWLN